MERFAVIDLGTNTFHLLIAQSTSDHLFKEVYRERIFVKLAEKGIERIGEDAFQRGINALHRFKKILEQHQINQFQVFGTAALRTAKNGPEFIQQIKEETGITIELISGEREAELIRKGVSLAVPFNNDLQLIMDIGGGSLEFIIANQQEVFWARSFPIGVAVLKGGFHMNDPISGKELKQLESYLEEQLRPLENMLEKYSIKSLVGASGTFDVLEGALPNVQVFDHHSILPIKGFFPFYDSILFSTVEERLKRHKIPVPRAEMLIVAIVLIHYVIRMAKIEEVIVSHFAMKEGMLKELMYNS